MNFQFGSLRFILFAIIFMTGCYAPKLADTHYYEGERQEKEGNFAAALENYEKAIAEAKLSNDPRKEELAYVIGLAGSMSYATGNRIKGYNYMQESVAMFRKLDNKVNLADQLARFAYYRLIMTELDSTTALYEEAIQILRDLHLGQELASCLLEVGKIYWYQKKYDVAATAYLEADSAYRAVKNLEGQAISLKLVGDLYKVKLDFKRSISSYEKSLFLYQWLRNDSVAAVIMESLVIQSFSIGEYGDVEKYCDQLIEIYRRQGSELKIAGIFKTLAQLKRTQGNYEDALRFYDYFNRIAETTGDQNLTVAARLEKANLLQTNGDFKEAIELYQSLIEVSSTDSNTITVSLNNMGLIYQNLGKYDKAIDCFNWSLSIDTSRGFKFEGAIAEKFENIGRSFELWGMYDVALEYLLQSAAINQKLGFDPALASNLIEIGNIFYSMPEYAKALNAYTLSLQLNRKYKLPSEGDVLNGIGNVYFRFKDYQRATAYYDSAISSYRIFGQTGGIATVNANKGLIFNSLGKYDSTIYYVRKALEVHESLNLKASVMYDFESIGAAYYWKRQYSEAIKSYLSATSIAEELRATAKGTIRRDYMSTTVRMYNALASCYVEIDDLKNAFDIFEKSRSRFLSEEISNEDFTVVSLDSVQAHLRSDQAILILHNKLQRSPGLLVTNGLIRSIGSIDTAEFGLFRSKYAKTLDFETQKWIKGLVDNDKLSRAGENEAGQYINQMYLNFLKSPPSREKDIGRDYARMYYKSVIKPIRSLLAKKSELLIVPDSYLGMFPFETLIDENGKYLCESFQITYVPSLTILEQLRKREYREKDRLPLLACGGASYEGKQSDDSLQSVSNSQIANLNQENGSIERAFNLLGYKGWKDLPGTLEEVRSIAQIVNGANLIIGRELNESNIKKMSNNGTLSKYKTIHFATHGIAVPEEPDLSSIVLSQANDTSQEDGYLQMSEIVKLRIHADFVNLSACETGVGKIYSGEGVVGLIHAFFVSGANAVSASLWQVADESTSKFMIDVYKSVATRKITYAQAITETKRKFIKGEFGEAYKSPYFWAPFVYYGK